MISFDPLIPVWLLLTALAGVCFVIYRTVGRKRLRLVCWLEAVLLGVMIADPVVTVRRPDSKNGGVALLVDSSASMQVPDADGKTRLDAANAFADRFLRRFGDAAPVTRYAFDYRLTPGEAAKPEFAAHWRGAFAKLDELHGAGALSAAVVLSDGGDVSGWRPGGASAPVFAVKFGTELGEARNASLGEFRVPETVRADSTVEFPVPVTLTGYDAPQKLELKLLEEGQVIQAEQFELAPGATETVKLKTEPVMAGLHRFSIELSSLPDEVTALDNRRAVAVDAEPDARFTLISFPRLSAGFRPLVRYFTRVRADFAAFYPAGAGGGVRRIGSRAGQAFEKGIPDRAEALKPVGVLILGDFDEAGWSAAQLAAVEAYVEQGGTLVLLGGRGLFPGFRRSCGAAAPLHSRRAAAAGYSAGDRRAGGQPFRGPPEPGRDPQSESGRIPEARHDRAVAGRGVPAGGRDAIRQGAGRGGAVAGIAAVGKKRGGTRRQFRDVLGGTDRVSGAFGVGAVAGGAAAARAVAGRGGHGPGYAAAGNGGGHRAVLPDWTAGAPHCSFPGKKTACSPPGPLLRTERRASWRSPPPAVRHSRRAGCCRSRSVRLSRNRMKYAHSTRTSAKRRRRSGFTLPPTSTGWYRSCALW